MSVWDQTSNQPVKRKGSGVGLEISARSSGSNTTQKSPQPFKGPYVFLSCIQYSLNAASVNIGIKYLQYIKIFRTNQINHHPLLLFYYWHTKLCQQ